MPCHWQNVPGVGMVHFNLATPRKLRCAFCNCPDAKALCDWPMMKPVPVDFKSIDELKIGDCLSNASGSWRAKILSISVGPPADKYSPPGYVACISVIQTVGTVAHALRTVTLGPATMGRAFVERPGTCDKPCCFRCRRHVDTDRDYCRDHWDLQAPAAEPVARTSPPLVQSFFGSRTRSGRALDRANQRRLFE